MVKERGDVGKDGDGARGRRARAMANRCVYVNVQQICNVFIKGVGYR